jgi:hypothetical protein
LAAAGNTFNRLKSRLVNAHQLTNIQKVEKLLVLPAVGQQKPSELLAEMSRFCPRGEEYSVFFNCSFLQKLPRDLHIFFSPSYFCWLLEVQHRPPLLRVCIVQASTRFIAVRTLFIRDVMTISEAKTTNGFKGS